MSLPGRYRTAGAAHEPSPKDVSLPEPARATIIGEGFWRGVTIRPGRRLTAS